MNFGLGGVFDGMFYMPGNNWMIQGPPAGNGAMAVSIILIGFVLLAAGAAVVWSSRKPHTGK